MIEIFDDSGILQLSTSSFAVGVRESYNVIGSFTKRNAGASLAIVPPLNQEVVMYPTQAAQGDTKDFFVSGLGEASMQVFECANTMHLVSQDTFGLALYGADGTLAYHSSIRPLKILGFFKSDPFGVPGYSTTSAYYSNATRSVFLNTVPLPPGKSVNDLALFIASMGAEGSAIQWKAVTGMPYRYTYYTVRPKFKLTESGLILGFSSELTRVVDSQTGHRDGQYAYTGGTGHIAGFFVDKTAF